jgi:hypothetical protein
MQLFEVAKVMGVSPSSKIRVLRLAPLKTSTSISVTELGIVKAVRP